MARGRKGGQRSGRAQSATRRRRYYEFSVKRAKPGCEGADMRRERTGKRKREKERENRRDEERGNHCWWDERKSGIKGASLRLPRLGHACGEIARVSMRSGRNPKSLRNWEKEIPSINLSLSLSLFFGFTNFHRVKITCNRIHASNMEYERRKRNMEN